MMVVKLVWFLPLYILRTPEISGLGMITVKRVVRILEVFLRHLVNKFHRGVDMRHTCLLLERFLLPSGRDS